MSEQDCGKKAAVKKEVINIPSSKTRNLAGDVWILVVVEVGKVIITHLSNSFIKVIENQPTIQTMHIARKSWQSILFIRHFFSRTLSPQQVLVARVGSGTCHVEERWLNRRKESCWSEFPLWSQCFMAKYSFSVSWNVRLGIFQSSRIIMLFRELEPMNCVRVYCEGINLSFDDKHLSDFEEILMFQLAMLHTTEN